MTTKRETCRCGHAVHASQCHAPDGCWCDTVTEVRQQHVYDYDAQKWTEDDELYLRQLRDHIELLESDQGADYAAFIGSPYPECLETAKHALSVNLASKGGVHAPTAKQWKSYTG